MKYAKITLIMSFTKNIPETVRNELVNGFDVTSEYCKTPQKWQIKIPKTPKIMPNTVFLPVPSPQSADAAKKPKINPPVAPKSF